MKILTLDIETAPALVHAWALRDQNIALNQVIQPGYILCWAAKWEDSQQVMFGSIREGQKTMLRRIHALLSEADAVIHYNGNSFDMPTLNAEFVEIGLSPPRPFVNIDLYVAVKKRFRWPSYKLEYVAKRLGVGQKVRHEGHGLWVKVMAGDVEAWERMEEYNLGDVLLTERVYNKLLPWIPNHPNRGLYADDERPRCYACGGERLQRSGTRVTRSQVYARFRCTSCGAWNRGMARERGPVARREA